MSSDQTRSVDERGMKKRFLVTIAITILGLTSACGPPVQVGKVGEPCTYTKIPGTITIISVEPAPENENNCRDAVKVTFTFTPTDPTARERYACPGWSDEGRVFTVGGGLNPNREWVKGKGIAAGTRHTATRNEIRSGTCTPVLFRFSSIDTDDYSAQCY